MRTALLFLLTAAFEIGGCYLPYRVLRHGGSAWLLGPGALALGVFAYLLTLHPSGAGRTYAAYGAVYIATALLWAWAVEGQAPTWSDAVGAALALGGAAVIVAGAAPAAQPP